MPLIVLICVSIHGCYIGSKVVVSLLALDLGASQFLIGGLASLYAVLPLVLGVYSGRLADTIGWSRSRSALEWASASRSR